MELLDQLGNSDYTKGFDVTSGKYPNDLEQGTFSTFILLWLTLIWLPDCTGRRPAATMRPYE